MQIWPILTKISKKVLPGSTCFFNGIRHCCCFEVTWFTMAPWGRDTENCQATHHEEHYWTKAAICTVFFGQMITELERTLRTMTQSKDTAPSTPTPHNRSNTWIDNNRTAALKRTAAKATRGLNMFTGQIYTRGSDVAKTQNILASL